MGDEWRYICLDWTLYLVFCGVVIAASFALASLVIPIRFDTACALVVLVTAWLVFHKLRSPPTHYRTYDGSK